MSDYKIKQIEKKKTTVTATYQMFGVWDVEESRLLTKSTFNNRTKKWSTGTTPYLYPDERNAINLRAAQYRDNPDVEKERWIIVPVTCTFDIQLDYKPKKLEKIPEVVPEPPPVPHVVINKEKIDLTDRDLEIMFPTVIP